MTFQINPLTLRAIREASDAIEAAVANPDRPRGMPAFRKALLASNPYPKGDEMHHPWRSAVATQLVSVGAGTWMPLGSGEWATLTSDQERRPS